MESEKAMQEEINQLRERHNLVTMTDPITHETKLIRHRQPGEKDYLPPVTEFVTIRYRNGVIVLAAEEFTKLPKRKQKKLMEW